MNQQITVRESLNSAMKQKMEENEHIIIMGEEVAEYNGAYKVTEGLLDIFGKDRVIDTPITEHGFTGIAVGAAFNGVIPIVEFMTFNFSMQAIDHIINSAAKTLYMSGGKMGCPIVFRGPNGAAARVGAQHSQCFASWYAHCPGLKVIAPYSANDAHRLLKAAIEDKNPVVFLENEILYGKKFDMGDDYNDKIEIGKAKIEREGSDITLVSFSMGVDFAIKAADRLKKEADINAEVINLRTLRPIDKEAIIKSIKKTNRLISIEEGWPYASISSEVVSIVTEEAFDFLDAPPTKITGEDVPLPYAANLEKMALLSVDKIVKESRKLCYR